jgi:hypothetical protein
MSYLNSEPRKRLLRFIKLLEFDTMKIDPLVQPSTRRKYYFIVKFIKFNLFIVVFITKPGKEQFTTAFLDGPHRKIKERF